MASNRSKSAPKRETRQALTFEMALQLCPHEGVAENVAAAFGLIAPDYDAIRAEHASALKRMAEAFEGSLNDIRMTCSVAPGARQALCRWGARQAR